MNGLSQGDIITISGFSHSFLIVSNNTFIKALGLLHVVPLLKDIDTDALHIRVRGKNEDAIAICEQLKLIDPAVRTCSRKDRIPYDEIMNISDAIQSVFEYD